LYNYYCISDPRGIAPQGFRIASHSDWTYLSNYLGGDTISGGKLKKDSLDFNVTFSGVRGENGAFVMKNVISGYWTNDSCWASYCNQPFQWYGRIRNIYSQSYYNELYNATAERFYGLSVKCVKN
jgi:uncharacterized protein (TIGR02145 family)